MTLPWPVLWLIDPAGAYMARRTPRIRGPVYTGGAVYGPDVPGGSRQATEEELRAMRSWRPDVDPEEVDPGEVAADLERRYGSELRRAAEQLCSSGTADLRMDGRHVQARVVRFWRGDSLLETTTTGPVDHGESRTRIPRQPDPGLLVGYLARS